MTIAMRGKSTYMKENVDLWKVLWKKDPTKKGRRKPQIAANLWQPNRGSLKSAQICCEIHGFGNF